MTKRNQSSKPKMAVIRQVRPSEALFYDAFQRMDVRFIFTTQNAVSYPVKTKNLEFVNLEFKPKWLFDPIANFNRGIYTNRSWVEITGLEKQLKDVDVVNTSSIFYVWSGQEARLAKKLGKKLVSIVWENIPHHLSTFIPPYSFSVREVVKSADLFILRSKQALRFTDSLGILRKKVKVIYKGVDLSMFHHCSPASPKRSRGRAKLKILYVGQLAVSKGVADLLLAFAKLSKELKDIELLIAGAGPLEKMVRRFSQNYPVSYKGFIRYKNLPGLYRQADIFCSPSKDLKYLGLKVWDECFSYTLMEAQASGLPIVATRCGGILEEVGKDNLLVEQGNIDSLCRALKKLIQDEALRKRLGRVNRKRAEKFFDLKKQAEKTEEVILEIL